MPIVEDDAAAYPLYYKALSDVLPAEGFRSRVALELAVLQLLEYGVLDRGKLFQLYGTSGGLPKDFDQILSRPSNDGMIVNTENSSYYVNFLWPIGLANFMLANVTSPLNGDSLPTFASTAGWTLGKEANGAAYFNKFPLVALRREEEARVAQIAKATYRPCCNNSTFFQDCNHGSALFGLLQLGASQGLDDDALYREALAFNAFWFPDQYLATAVYFMAFEDLEWREVDARVALGYDFSALGPWQRNVAAKLAASPGLIPPEPGAALGCGI